MVVCLVGTVAPGSPADRRRRPNCECDPARAEIHPPGGGIPPYSWRR